MRCECGCGYEGPDEVANFLVAEAMELHLSLLDDRAYEEQQRRAEVKAMQDRVAAETAARRKADLNRV